MKHANPLDAIRNSHQQLPAKAVVEKVVAGTPSEDPEPCLFCGSPTWWRSAYGGELKCSVCEPWPARAMVGERWTLRMGPGRQLSWMECLRPGEHTRDLPDPNDLVDQTEASLGWRNQEIEDEFGSWWRFERCGPASGLLSR